MRYIKELASTRELLGNLVARELKGQYRRTVFGQLWSLANPLATMLVYTLVFGVFLQATPPLGDPSGVEGFAIWLLCGLVPWLFLSRVINGSIETIIGNAGLISKVYFPRAHLALAVTLSVGFTWALEMVVLCAVLIAFGALLFPWLPLTFVVMVLLAMFATGLGMLFSIANVHFRDTQHFVAILLQMWFYLTPIVYPIQLVIDSTREHPWVLTLYRLNPMEHFVAVFRNLLYDNRWPDPTDLTWCLVSAVVAGTLGFLVFTRAERRLAELL